MDPFFSIQPGQIDERGARSEFSKLIVADTLKPLFQPEEGQGLFGKGNAASIYGGWFSQILASELVQNGLDPANSGQPGPQGGKHVA